MPATSREPLVAQNGVEPSPNSPRRRTSSLKTAVLPTPALPTRRTLRPDLPLRASASLATASSISYAGENFWLVRSWAVCSSVDDFFSSGWPELAAICFGVRIVAIERSRVTLSPRVRSSMINSRRLLVARRRINSARAWFSTVVRRSSGLVLMTSIPRAGINAMWTCSP